MLASVIVPAFRCGDVIHRCVASVLATEGMAVEVIVVDNGADEPTRTAIASLPQAVRVVRTSRNRGFASGCNAGLAVARGDLLVLLNDDAEVDPGWLLAADEVFRADARIAIVGARVLSWDRETLEHAGGFFYPRWGLTGHRGEGEKDCGQYDRLEDVDYVMGAALALRRSVYERLGPLEPSYFMYYEEVEYCLSARRLGLRVCYVPRMRVYHIGRHSSGGMTNRFYYLYHRSRLRYLLRNASREELKRFLRDEPALYVHPPLRAYAGSLLRAHLSLLPELPAILLARRRHLRHIAALASSQR